MKNDLKICMSQLNFKVGAIENNTSKIISAIKSCKKKKVDIICFPELCILSLIHISEPTRPY